MAMKSEEQIWADINAEMPDAEWEPKYAQFKIRVLAEQLAEHQAATSAFEDKQMASLNRIEAFLYLKFGVVAADSLPEPPEPKPEAEQKPNPNSLPQAPKPVLEYEARE